MCDDHENWERWVWCMRQRQHERQAAARCEPQVRLPLTRWMILFALSLVVTFIGFFVDEPWTQQLFDTSSGMRLVLILELIPVGIVNWRAVTRKKADQ